MNSPISRHRRGRRGIRSRVSFLDDVHPANRLKSPPHLKKIMRVERSFVHPSVRLAFGRLWLLDIISPISDQHHDSQEDVLHAALARKSLPKRRSSPGIEEVLGRNPTIACTMGLQRSSTFCPCKAGWPAYQRRGAVMARQSCRNDRAGARPRISIRTPRPQVEEISAEICQDDSSLTDCGGQQRSDIWIEGV